VKGQVDRSAGHASNMAKILSPRISPRQGMSGHHFEKRMVQVFWRVFN
jgi:hypothetical protein